MVNKQKFEQLYKAEKVLVPPKVWALLQNLFSYHLYS